MLKRLLRLPFELRIALVALLGGSLLNIQWALSQSSWKIDPGFATLVGAVIGFAIIGHQARRGFSNLIRSQTNQAELDRAARIHKAELDEAAKRADQQAEKALLLAAIRAELAVLFQAVGEQRTASERLADMARDCRGLPSTVRKFAPPIFHAPIFQANIGKISLLGPYLGADVIRVLSKADGKAREVTFDQPLTHEMCESLYCMQARSLMKWTSDMFHVAMRIRAEEDGSPDPGTLVETEDKRYAEIGIADEPPTS